MESPPEDPAASFLAPRAGPTSDGLGPCRQPAHRPLSPPRATLPHCGVRQVRLPAGLPPGEPQGWPGRRGQRGQPQLQLPGQPRGAGPDHGRPHLLRLADLSGDAVPGGDEGVCRPSLAPTTCDGGPGYRGPCCCLPRSLSIGTWQPETFW